MFILSKRGILSPDFPLSEVISYYRDSTETATNPHKRPANEEERLRSLTRSYIIYFTDRKDVG